MKSFQSDGGQAVILGRKLWEFETGSAIESSPAIGANGTVYVGSDDGWLYAVNGSTGTKIWEFETGGWINSSPAIGANGTILDRVTVGCMRLTEQREPRSGNSKQMI